MGTRRHAAEMESNHYLRSNASRRTSTLCSHYVFMGVLRTSRRRNVRRLRPLDHTPKGGGIRTHVSRFTGEVTVIYAPAHCSAIDLQSEVAEDNMPVRGGFLE